MLGKEYHQCQKDDFTIKDYPEPFVPVPVQNEAYQAYNNKRIEPYNIKVPFQLMMGSDEIGEDHHKQDWLDAEEKRLY